MQRLAVFFPAVLALALLASVPALAERGVTAAPFGQTPDGEQAQIFTLVNKSGSRARISNFGGVVVSLEVPDKDGKLGDVVLGFGSLEGYLGEHPYFGSLVGRYGNRIAKGRFTLDGRGYSLAVNNGPNALHGGLQSFNRRIWGASSFVNQKGVGLRLTLISPAGEEGYPGTLAVRVDYTLDDDNSLRIDYHATTDAPTVVNLTNHSYFNLKDAGKTPILDHEVQIQAAHFTPVDSTLIPTGELAPVLDTPFDFQTATKIGARIDAPDEQIRFGGGYDHNWVLNRRTGSELEHLISVYEPTTGRVMEVHTTQPGVQFYTGNFLDGSNVGKGGTVYQRRHGFCFETQHFPNSPNQAAFPSTVLRPGETLESTTIYKFSTR